MNLADKKKFFGKILLLGEYSIIEGGEALTVPFERVSGYFDFPPDNMPVESASIESNNSLKEFFSYLEAQQKISKFIYPLDFDRLENDLNRGMFFNSNIPQGYGAGSSGALVAALFYYYAQGFSSKEDLNKSTLQSTREQLALMESVFHGSSSGIDPLTSLLTEPLWVRTGKKISFPELPLFSESFHYTVFLVDTGSSGNTKPLVDWYKRQVSTGQFNAELLMALNNQVLQALLKKDNFFFETFLAQLSLFQLENMRPMIPDSIKPLWQQGIYSGEWMLKLCGSGGGGYALGIATDFNATMAEFSKSGMEIIPVFH
ncbi:MAG: mevalonate kinase [Bacteroidales bacterium]